MSTLDSGAMLRELPGDQRVASDAANAANEAEPPLRVMALQMRCSTASGSFIWKRSRRFASPTRRFTPAGGCTSRSPRRTMKRRNNARWTSPASAGVFSAK